jgi:hypothetical protein
MSAKPLMVHNAELSTASISVRILQIEGKQVTLAVFRQLLEEHIVDENCNLKGTPWGHVNYLLDDTANFRGAINLLWQKGTELRRCILYPKMYRQPFRFREKPISWPENDETKLKMAKYLEERNAALAEYEKEQQTFAAYEEVVKPLFDFPHLFIAV